MAIAIVLVIIIMVVVAVSVWKVTGHNFGFIKKIFEPRRRLPLDKWDAAIDTDSKIERKVTLESGGTLIISCDVNIFKINQNDRSFINSVIDIIQAYEGKLPVTKD